MNRGSQIFGLAIGAVLALIVMEARTAAPVPHAGAMLSECGGALRRIVIQYVRGDDIAGPVYRDFLRYLSRDVTVDVICPDRAAFDELRIRIGPVRCALSPILVGHDMTVWSRDRWIALESADSTGATTLLTPMQENASDLWPARAGDARIAADLAGVSKGQIQTRRLGLLFDGGDLLADKSTVWVTPAVVAKNLQVTVNSRDELIKLLKHELSRDVVLLDPAPEHHAGMYMMAAGDRTMLVGDPGLGRAALDQRASVLPSGFDFSGQTQEYFDSVARQVESHGYRVVRIPIVPSTDGRTYLTYVNVITETNLGRKIVYMPVYRGYESLNDAAAGVWQSIGYEVRRVDCTSSYQHFGNLHCLVNVLRRG